MLIANDKAAGAAGLHWQPGQAVEVPEAVATELLSIKDAGFYVPGDAAGITEVEPEPTLAEVKPETPSPRTSGK